MQYWHDLHQCKVIVKHSVYSNILLRFLISNFNVLIQCYFFELEHEPNENIHFFVDEIGNYFSKIFANTHHIRL